MPAMERSYRGIVMRTVLTCAAFAAAIALAAPATAQNSDSQTLSAWLAGCQTNRQQCIADLRYGYEAAYEDMGEICPPQNLAESDAAEQELRWLQNAAAYNSALANGRELDAEWTALHTLWPCSD